LETKRKKVFLIGKVEFTVKYGRILISKRNLDAGNTKFHLVFQVWRRKNAFFAYKNIFRMKFQ